MNTATLKATPSTFNIPPVGAFLEDQGGLFLGVVRVEGHRYGIIQSPAAGDLEGVWGEYGKKIDAAHLSDGLKNTMAMAESGSLIAQAALSLTINDRADWYIPARDEEELQYRVLKPTDDENCCSFRDGENPSSEPVNLGYTETFPAQTAIESYREGGEHAMQGTYYWSSTQYSAYTAFVQDFRDGDQGVDDKSRKWRARAVRRFLID